MRIIVNELKKIWNFKILVIITVACCLYFALFTSNYTHMTPHPRGSGSFLDIAHHLTDTYGPTLSREDFEDFLNHREVIIADLNEFIASRQVFIDNGIFNYDDYRALRDDVTSRWETLTDEELVKYYTILGELGTTFRMPDGTDFRPNPYEPSLAHIMLWSYDNIVGMYRQNALFEFESGWGNRFDNFIKHTALNEREIARVVEIRDSDERYNIMEQWVMRTVNGFWSSFAGLVILVTLILVATLITADRANRVNWLQYSSKEGRKIFKKQFAAIIMSAIAMTTILLAIYGWIFATNELGALAFWNNGLNSFMGYPFFWTMATLGTYCLMMIGISYLLSIGVATFAFVFSRFSQNKVKLLLKVVPLFIAMTMLSNWILEDFLAIYYGGDVIVQLSALVLALFASMIAAIIVVKRERRVELV